MVLKGLTHLHPTVDEHYCEGTKSTIIGISWEYDGDIQW